MKKVSDLIIFSGAIVAFSVSLNLFRQEFGVTSPWFALLAMFCILGTASLGRDVFELKQPMALREIRAWESKGHLYRLLGVPLFGALLRRTPLRRLNSRVYIDWRHTDFPAIRKQLEMAEAAHLFAAVFVTTYIVYAVIQGWWTVAMTFVVIQIVGNVYPILHLRHVRSRIDRFVVFKHPKRGCHMPA